MNYDQIYTAFYSLYRGDSDIPASTDDEYIVGMRLANEAIQRWANFDNTFWNELYTTLQTNGGGSQTIVTGQTAYLAPGNYKEAGGFVKVLDSTGNIAERYPIIQPQEAQFQGTESLYAYFTTGQNYYSTGTVSQATTVATGVGTTFTAAMVGMKIQYDSGETATITAFTSGTEVTVSPSQTVASTTYKIINPGYTLNLNPAPLATYNGYDIDYTYYKKPTEFTTGTSKTEMPNPYFIVHRMLAQQYRVSRNPYYSSALRDSEDALKIMQTTNNSGTWANTPVMNDNSGMSWGN
jgi:hypothetical protein